MLASILSFVLIAASAYALPPRYPHTSQRSLSNPVTWVTKLDSIAADTDVRLEWAGGDGYGWQVYYIPQWAEQSNYHVRRLLPYSSGRVADLSAYRYRQEHYFYLYDLAHSQERCLSCWYHFVSLRD